MPTSQARFHAGDLSIDRRYTQRSMARQTILVVDDQPELRTLLGRMLTPAGYHVVACPDGDTALVAAREHAETLALAIVDAHLGEARGEDVLLELHARFPRLPMLTTSGGLEDGHRLPGVLGHLPKPFGKAELLQLVARHAGPGSGGRRGAPAGSETAGVVPDDGGC